MAQIITSAEEISNLEDNIIIGNFDFIQSKITFSGKGNILITHHQEKRGTKLYKTILENTTIEFKNNNSVVFLSESNKSYSISLAIHNNSFCYIGKNNYFNGILKLQCSEQCNILIGDNCMFSFGIWVRTSDVHLIYAVNSNRRINRSKSVFIGDHVWIGQDARVWKGTQIGSGAILGASAFSAGKRIPSNTAWGGNPARLIKSGVFFLGNSSHAYTNAETEIYSECSDDAFIYNFDVKEALDFHQLEEKCISLGSARERADFLLDFSKRKFKNRFFIYEPTVSLSKTQKMVFRLITPVVKRLTSAANFQKFTENPAAFFQSLKSRKYRIFGKILSPPLLPQPCQN